MLAALLIGSLALVVNMAIQLIAAVAVVRFLLRRLDDGRLPYGVRTDYKAISLVLLVLFVGHLLQFATWAALFLGLGEFTDFQTAFYHSTVNFTSLGYGDIVMSEQWRLLGALEAANGVLMFGLTAGTVLSVMNYLFMRHRNAREVRERHRG
jgi:hypothetical protein